LPAPLSVIMPTLNAAECLPAAAAALGEGLTSGLVADLVVSDGGSTEATLEIASALGATIVTGPPSRGGQLRRGVAEARGEWLLLLHPDTILSDGWSEAVRDHIAEHPGRAGFFRLAFRARGFGPAAVAGWINLRSLLFRLPCGAQGLLVSRAVLEAAGGVPDITLMEDVALARALGGRLRSLPATARVSAARYEREGWLRRSFTNGIAFARYHAGTPPKRLARGPRTGD